MTYRGIDPPEHVDLYRYQNGEITARIRRAEHSGTGPPWNSHKMRTRLEPLARQRLAALLKKLKIEDVEADKVPLIVSSRPKQTKVNLPAVIPAANGNMTEAERRAYKNGYNAASYHVKKNGVTKATPKAVSGTVAARDVVGALAASMNASAVILRLLQDATGDTTSD